MGQRDTNFTARLYSLPPVEASPRPRSSGERSANASSLRIVVVDDDRGTVLSTVLLLRECRHLEPLAARRNRAATLCKARFGIKLVNGVLRAELVERETKEETAAFLNALLAESKRTRCRKVLISVRESLPILKPQQEALWPLV